MVRSFTVFGLAFAGVFLLAGPGWALVTGACLVLVLWRREPDWRALASRARRLAGRVRAAPRRAVAAGGMTAGLLLLPAGFAVALGLGAGLIAAGAGVAGVALLTGWNA
jgi:hypothetical protein